MNLKTPEIHPPRNKKNGGVFYGPPFMKVPRSDLELFPEVDQRQFWLGQSYLLFGRVLERHCVSSSNFVIFGIPGGTSSEIMLQGSSKLQDEVQSQRIKCSP